MQSPAPATTQREERISRMARIHEKVILLGRLVRLSADVTIMTADNCSCNDNRERSPDSGKRGSGGSP